MFDVCARLPLFATVFTVRVAKKTSEISMEQNKNAKINGNR